MMTRFSPHLQTGRGSSSSNPALCCVNLAVEHSVILMDLFVSQSLERHISGQCRTECEASIVVFAHCGCKLQRLEGIGEDARRAINFPLRTLARRPSFGTPPATHQFGRAVGSRYWAGIWTCSCRAGQGPAVLPKGSGLYHPRCRLQSFILPLPAHTAVFVVGTLAMQLQGSRQQTNKKPSVPCPRRSEGSPSGEA